LSAGQGSAARAALLERVPYFGFVLGEQHGKKLEMQLTDFVLEEMRREGSSHYRPEAAKSPQTADETEANQKTKSGKPEKPKKREKESTGNEKEETKPKKPKKTKPEKETKDETPAAEGEGEGEEEAEGGSPLPW